MTFFILTSCRTTESIKTIQIEVMKPVDFSIPEDVKTIAIFNRNFKSHFDTLYNIGASQFKVDTTFDKTAFSNCCVDGLSNFLEQEAFFQKVSNYRDSLDISQKDTDLNYKYSDLFGITKADALIFLDLLQFENGVFVYFDGTFRTRAALSWTIIFKNKTFPENFNSIDTLYFSKSQYHDVQEKKQQSQQIYEDISKFLGKSFGKKLIPSWVQVDRMYYHSKNSEMIKAENYAINRDWLKAAEIWNRQTKNKNQEIAAKACYNMALACEMDGKYDLAIEWLNNSNTILIKQNEQYKANCKQYIRVLNSRKDEIEKLEKQIR